VPRAISLRKRLLLYVVVINLVMMAASGSLIYRNTLKEADEIFDASLAQTARLLDGLITREVIATHGAELQSVLQRGPNAHEYERKLFFIILDDHGAILLKSRNAPDLPENPDTSGFSKFSSGGQTWFSFSLESSHQDLHILVGEDSDIRQEITEYIGSGLILPLLLVLPPVLGLLWILVSVALNPLRQITHQLRQQHLNDLRPIDVATIPSEIEPMVDALNRMIGDLNAAYARERRFIGDASHELRNPLASLLINVENALEESQDAELGESLEAMRLSIQRLSNLVAQLLELSRFECPREQHDFTYCNLFEICQRVISELASQAKSRQQSLELEGSTRHCEIRAVENLLHSLVSNLLDNAIVHSGRGSTIRLSCSELAESVELEVQDSGQGLSEEQLHRAKDRFYRAGDTNAPGSGLGLAIVESIAKIHDGKVVLQPSDLGGLRVRVNFKKDTERRDPLENRSNPKNMPE
jgi:two-component system sensor histidine kinase QseC